MLGLPVTMPEVYIAFMDGQFSVQMGKVNPFRKKKFERSSGSEGAKYKNIMPGYQIKTWNKFLTISSNKSELVQFLIFQWKQEEFREKLGESTVFVTMQDQCWKLDSISCDNVPDLCCNHEEADTRMILHAIYSGGTSVIHCDDTDVLVLLLSHNGFLGQCYLKKGRGSMTRIIELALIVEKLVKQLTQARLSKVPYWSTCINITGCDTVSAFAGKGKWKALKLLLKNKSYVTAMMDFGESWQLSDETFNGVESFVCHLYGKKYQDVDLLRYELHCAKGGKVVPEALPSCRSSLKLHALRANYQAAI